VDLFALQPSPVIERPSDWIARGAWQAPSWAIAALGGAVVVTGTGYFFWRARRARKRVP
jgi:hypothetical protein